MSDEEIAAIKKALEEMAEHNKKDLSDFKKYLKDEVVHGIQQTINENTQNIENNTNAGIFARICYSKVRITRFFTIVNLFSIR